MSDEVTGTLPASLEEAIEQARADGDTVAATVLEEVRDGALPAERARAVIYMREALRGGG